MSLNSLAKEGIGSLITLLLHCWVPLSKTCRNVAPSLQRHSAWSRYKWFEILSRCRKRVLTYQQITRIQVVHNEQYVFNDIKPENFLVSDKKIYITDFGLTVSHPGLDMPRTRLNGSLPTGTARYMSVDAHVFKERYPKDDLEALGHVFVYFMGRLPWMGLKTEPALTRTQQEEHLKILELKKKTTTEALCEGLQSEIGQYLAYARGLTPEEEPDYDFMRGLFQSGMESRGEADDGCFCWLANEEPPRTRSRHR